MNVNMHYNALTQTVFRNILQASKAPPPKRHLGCDHAHRLQD